MSPFQSFVARLVGSTLLSEQTRHLEFEMVDVARFGFVPGQWLSFRSRTPAGDEITRAYSIASAPSGDNRFALCLNRVQDGFMSNHLCGMTAGAEIACEGPFGNFTLRPPPTDTLLVATGTGIAPFRSMLHWALADPARHKGRHCWLVFGSRDEQSLYYHDEFVRLAAAHGNFLYLPTLSRGGPGWDGLRGRVQEHFGGIVRGRDDLRAYVCGLKDMVASSRELLQQLGVDRTSILYEKYD
jgi:ferredoxin-NADP reductase